MNYSFFPKSTYGVDWHSKDESRGYQLRWRDIVNYQSTKANDFVFGFAELDSGNELALHRHPQAETLYVLSGQAKIRLGARKVEIGPASAAYFPPNIPHSIKTLGKEKFEYLYTYSTPKTGQNITLEAVSDHEANQFDLLNLPDTRWALSEDFENWVACEPTKGDGVRIRFLFDEVRGKHLEMQVGVGEIGPNIHYTLHYHAMPEIYYVLDGSAIVWLGDEKVAVSKGDTLYLPANIVHGADNISEQPLRLYYIYGLESVGALNWQDTWRPVEDIYTHPRVQE
jgi:mannose-6-phosphate isomerase-like protein (cupin superfamily)